MVILFVIYTVSEASLLESIQYAVTGAIKGTSALMNKLAWESQH